MRVSFFYFLDVCVLIQVSSAGRVLVIVFAAVSAAAVFAIGAAIGVHMWKNKVIEKKRKGRTKPQTSLLLTTLVVSKHF